MNHTRCHNMQVEHAIKRKGLQLDVIQGKKCNSDALHRWEKHTGPLVVLTAEVKGFSFSTLWVCHTSSLRCYVCYYCFQIL